MAPLDTGPDKGRFRRSRLVVVGETRNWSRARARFGMRLGGLALASKQVAQIRRHSDREQTVVGGGSVTSRMNDGIRGGTEMSDASVLYLPEKTSAATKGSDTCSVFCFRKMGCFETS